MKRLESQTGSTVRNRAAEGFSLIELLVVVAVILILAALAIPNYVRSKISANESSAVQSMRNISAAELYYANTYGINFSNTLLELSGSGAAPDQTNAGLVDGTLAAGQKSGYLFSYTPLLTDAQGHPRTYALTADPMVQGSTGQRHFYTDQTGVIRVNPSVPAGPTDLPIQ
jgi:prepilin-type N-terminal cleavage/methylation domain-containing protein